MLIRGREAWGPVLTMGLLQSALIACLPWLIERTGLSAGVWSVILSAGMVPVLCGAPLWGRFVDRRGAGRVLRLTSALVMLGYALVLAVLAGELAPWLAATLLLIARLIHGLGAGGVFPAAQRIVVADAEPQQWSYRLSRLQMAVHAGRLAGPALVALAAWLGMMPMLCLAGVLALVMVTGTGRRSKAHDAGSVAMAGAGAELPWRHGAPYYLIALLLTFWIGALQFVLGPWLTRVAGVSAQVGSSLTATALVLTSLVGLLLGPLVHAWVRANGALVVIWGVALGTGGVLLSRATGVAVIYGGVAAVAFGAAVLTPWYGSQLRQCHPRFQGEIAGRLTSIHTLGYIAGTLAGGWLLEARLESPLAMFVLLVPVLVLLAYQSVTSGRRCTAG